MGDLIANGETGASVRAKLNLYVPDPDATTYAIRASAAGYDLSSSEFAAVNLLCRRLKAGGVWGKIDEFWMLALGSAATYKLGGKRRSDLTANGTLTFTKGFGVRGDGSTGYLDTGINPTTFVGTNWELNSACVGVFCNDPTVREGSAPNNNRLVGQGATGGNLRLVARFSSGNAAAGYIDDGTPDAVSAVTTIIPALISIARLGAADKRIFNNRRQVGAFTTASTSVSSGNIMLLKDNANYGAEQIAFAYVAYGLRPAEILALSDAVTEFLQSIMAPIGAFGDSLTYGPASGGAEQMTNPWPKTLQSALGRFVYNGGISGETSSQVRARVTSDDFLANGTEIYWAGKNNVSASATVLSDAATAVAWNKTGRVLVIGVTPTTGNDAASGQPDYASRMAINVGLQSTYGARYLDLLPALQAANDGSANDLADVAGGQIPRSLRWPGDNTHISDTVNGTGYSGAGVVAATIQAKLAALGY